MADLAGQLAQAQEVERAGVVNVSGAKALERQTSWPVHQSAAGGQGILQSYAVSHGDGGGLWGALAPALAGAAQAVRAHGRDECAAAALAERGVKRR